MAQSLCRTPLVAVVLVIEPMNREDFQIGGVPTSLYATGREIVELVASAGGVITLTLGIDPTGFLDSNESVAPEIRLVD